MQEEKKGDKIAFQELAWEPKQIKIHHGVVGSGRQPVSEYPNQETSDSTFFSSAVRLTVVGAQYSGKWLNGHLRFLFWLPGDPSEAETAFFNLRDES